jgi:ABC-type transport system involved in cytochrome bd biosynthesis fused ATPase/permease subunit
MQLTEIDKPEAIESLLSWVSSISVSLAPIYTLEQLATSTHIAELLLMIEPEFFKPLAELP